MQCPLMPSSQRSRLVHNWHSIFLAWSFLVLFMSKLNKLSIASLPAMTVVARALVHWCSAGKVSGAGLSSVSSAMRTRAAPNRFWHLRLRRWTCARPSPKSPARIVDMEIPPRLFSSRFAQGLDAYFPTWARREEKRFDGISIATMHRDWAHC